ncbi:MAG TPA: hypothetical protein VFC19_11765 [Candidatus Limnocylindrales bacterium]|nr:hypothetical protein [Candidatus Limnocylindrales bacterium]
MNTTVVLLLVAVLSLLTGAVSKISDLFNDDGLEWFPGADPLSGVLWAATGSALVLLDPQVAALWLATVMYWFLRSKLDHFNHAFAGVCISGTGVFCAARGKVDLTVFVGLFAWLAVSGYLNTWLKNRHAADSPGLRRFLRLRLRYYAGPILIALLTTNALPAVSVLAGMAGTEAVTEWWRRSATKVDVGTELSR